MSHRKALKVGAAVFVLGTLTFSAISIVRTQLQYQSNLEIKKTLGLPEDIPSRNMYEATKRLTAEPSPPSPVV